MMGNHTQSPSSTEMREELLTSSFGSHESVCKHDQPDLGVVTPILRADNNKIETVKTSIYKVNMQIIKYNITKQIQNS